MDTIYTIGGGAILEYIFNAVAILCSGSIIAQAAKITASVGIMWILIANMIDTDWVKNSKWFVVMAVSYNILMIPKTDISIRDQMEPMVPRHVDNVPFVLGRLVSLTSTMGNINTEGFEAVFSLPDDVSYSKNGFLMGSELMDYMGRITINDLTLKRNVEAFMVRCVQRSIVLGQYSHKEILGSPNLYQFLQERGLSNLRSVTFEEDNPTGGYQYKLYSCQEAFTEIIRKFNLGEGQTILGKALATITKWADPDSAKDFAVTMAAMLPANYEYFLGESKSAVDILYHHLLVNAYYEGISDNAGIDYQSAKASLQAQHTYQAIGKLAKESVPFIRVIFEVILYAMFPILVLLLMLPGAPKIFYYYVQALIWIQMWGPIYAVLHFGATFWQKNRMSNLISASEQYSAYNIATVHDIMASSSAIFSYMTMFTPFLAWMLLKGFSSLVHLSGSMNSPAMGAASSSAAETTSGNISMGQLQFKNVMHDTEGGFNYDKGLNVSTADSIQRSDKAIEHFGADGKRSVDYGQAISHLPFKPSQNTSISQRYEDAASYSSRQSEEEMQSAVNSWSSAFNKIYESRHFQDQIDSNSTDFSQRDSTTEHLALSRVESAAEEFAQNHNMTKETATSLMMGLNGNVNSGNLLKAGMGKLLKAAAGTIGLEIGGSGKIDTISRDTIDDLQRFINSKELKDDLSTVHEAMKSDSLNLRNDDGSSLSESYQGDVKDAFDFQDSASTHFAQSQEFMQRAEQSRSNSYNVDYDLTNDLVDYVSKKYGNEKTKDMDFMEEVAESEEFNHHWASNHYNDFNASPKSHIELEIAAKQERIEQEKMDEFMQHQPIRFKNKIFDLHSTNRDGIDNSNLQQDVKEKLNDNHNELFDKSVGNEGFKNDVRGLASEDYASKMMFYSNKSDQRIFDGDENEIFDSIPKIKEPIITGDYKPIQPEQEYERKSVSLFNPIDFDEIRSGFNSVKEKIKDIPFESHIDPKYGDPVENFDENVDTIKNNELLLNPDIHGAKEIDAMTDFKNPLPDLPNKIKAQPQEELVNITNNIGFTKKGGEDDNK